MIQPVSCPICQKTLPPEVLGSKWFPFCSQRCKEIDLSRWLDGKYAVVQELDPQELYLQQLEGDLPLDGEPDEQ